MEDILRIIVQWAHVLTAVLWVGGGTYTIAVQLPAVRSIPPQLRAQVIAAFVPRQLFYLLRVAELTLATGVANLLLSPRLRQLERLDSRWAIVMVLGILLALVLYGFVRAVVVPTIRGGLTLGTRAAAGDAEAQKALAAFPGRVLRLGLIQIALGFVIILAMVVARFG